MNDSNSQDLSSTEDRSNYIKAADTKAADTEILSRVANTLKERLSANADSLQTSYTAQLLAKGPDSFLKKIGEEAVELVMAAKDAVPERIISETADLWFHCLVALAYYGLRPEAVLAELSRREGISGIEEKSRRVP